MFFGLFFFSSFLKLYYQPSTMPSRDYQPYHASFTKVLRCNLQRSPGRYRPRARICSHCRSEQPQLSQNNGDENANLTRCSSCHLLQPLHYFIGPVNQNFTRCCRCRVSDYYLV